MYCYVVLNNSVYKLLNAAGYPKEKFTGANGKLFKWSKPIFRNFIMVTDLTPDDDDEQPIDDELPSKKGMDDNEPILSLTFTYS